PDNREFICVNDEFSTCQTGQYTLNLSRKVISNHFGRNKACTRAISEWPLFCRKHYQRATYKPDLWQRRKIDLIARQFEVIEAARPGTTYTISLKKSEEARLNAYARLTDKGLTHESACAHDTVAEQKESKSFQAPIQVLREIDDFLGPNQTKERAGELVGMILDMLNQNECKQVPSIEWLPQIPSQRAAKTKAAPKPNAESKAKAKAGAASKVAAAKPAAKGAKRKA
ncbi:hypothetical protein B0J11DRAFT_395601, partial [Dendryphion nanum]